MLRVALLTAAATELSQLSQSSLFSPLCSLALAKGNFRETGGVRASQAQAGTGEGETINHSEFEISIGEAVRQHQSKDASLSKD